MSALVSIALSLSLGTIAITAILASWLRYAPRISELRGALAKADEPTELRLTVQEQGIVPEASMRRPLRHRPCSSEGERRLHRRKLRHAAA